MGQPAGHGEAALRGAIAEGGPSLLPQLLQLSWALEPGALWGPVGSLPAPSLPPSLRWGRGIEQAPGNARPWCGRGWAGPLLSSAPRGSPARCGRNSGEGGHLARHDLCPGPGRPAAPSPVVPRSPSHLNHSFPRPLNSWCFQGNYLMNQQCGDCGGGMGLPPSAGPPGTEGTCGAAEPPAAPPTPTPH